LNPLRLTFVTIYVAWIELGLKEALKHLQKVAFKRSKSSVYNSDITASHLNLSRFRFLKTLDNICFAFIFRC